ncbi:MAG: hypothetical protein ACK4YP_12835 [Myxococcota bacterium]
MFLFSGIFLASVLVSAARAQEACPVGQVPAPFPAPADPGLAVFEVEGRIASYDRTARTLTANGMTFRVPEGFLVATIDLDAPGNITFEALTDPTLEAERSIIGGTVIAGGSITFTDVGGTQCADFVPANVFVELAENGLVGPLFAVDAGAGTFSVNGAPIRMNEDPRFPADIIDVGGNPLALEDLVGNEGALMDVGGYYDSEAGVLFATLVEAEVLATEPGRDTVVIERTEGRPNRLRVRGLVSVNPATGTFVSAVSVHPGRMNTEGTACADPPFGTAAVDPTDGAWDFRRNSGPIPGFVCAQSPGGGVDEAPVTLR